MYAFCDLTLDFQQQHAAVHFNQIQQQTKPDCNNISIFQFYWQTS